jgi:hypothetical protein
VSIAVPRPPDRDSRDARRAIWFVVRPDRAQLTEISALLASGTLRTVIGGVLPLERGREAYGAGRRVGPGKVVLRVVGQART